MVAAVSARSPVDVAAQATIVRELRELIKAIDRRLPHIERAGEDHYWISLALAGFKPEEVTITAEQNVLTVEGHKNEKEDHQYLYQGISARSFRRVFKLADYVELKGVSFDGG